MKTTLPATGTALHLAELDRHIPDDFINKQLPRRQGRGRRQHFRDSQLWRVHLLTVLTHVQAFNQLVRMLSEQRAWRQFAHLSHRERVPDVRMLHEFRDRIGVVGMRRINEHLLAPLIPMPSEHTRSVTLIDATDLPASASGFKKNEQAVIRLNMRHWVREH